MINIGTRVSAEFIYELLLADNGVLYILVVIKINHAFPLNPCRYVLN